MPIFASSGNTEIASLNDAKSRERASARCGCGSTVFRRFLSIQEETRRCHSYFIRMFSRTSSESDSSCNRVLNATRFVNGLMSFTSSSLNKDAPLAFRRLLDSNVGSKVHLHRFSTKNDSITARAGYPGLVRLSANIVKVLTQWIRALETAHWSLIPRASSPVRELRNRSCGDSLLVSDEHSTHLSDSFVQVPASHRSIVHF